MKKSDKSINYPLSISIFACVLYAISTFVLNIFLSLNSVVLEVWANLLIFCLLFIVSTIIVLTKKVSIKSFILKTTTILYTVLSFILNITFAITASLSMWHWTTIVLLAVYSVAISLMLVFLKINSYLIRTLIYYVVSYICFFILTNVIGGYTAGNLTIILFGIFALSYIAGSIIFFYIKRSFLQIENEEQEYKKQFD